MADTQQDTEKTASDPVCTFKKPGSRRNTRKRSEEESALTDETQTVIVQREVKAREADNIVHHKATKTQSVEVHKFQSSGTASSLGSMDQGATSIVETETEFDRDGVSILKRNKGNVASEAADDGLYHGLNQYRTFIQKREDASGVAKGAGIRAGPVRASSHIRVTSRFDYQPDLCKDYKETGYCGYGDSCKFMHDRGDYKTGWQLDQEWEEQEKAKAADRAAGRRVSDGPAAPAEEEDDMPFACFICRNPFTHPVITKCKHLFCEKCALENHKTTKKCFVCNEPTAGIFNVPSKQILVKLEKKKQQMAEQQAGEDNGGSEQPSAGGEEENKAEDS